MPTKPNIYGTMALASGVTPYDVRWRRVSAADQADPRILALASRLRGLDSLTMLSAVQSEIGRRVTWRRDLDEYRVADYWANASETLSRGRGDAEDIAIAKIQVLKAAGFPASDLYISVGKDRSRGLDTLLFARANDRFYVLDDREARPMTPEEHARFEPVITLGHKSTWLHGRRHRSSSLARAVR
ncbi:transglutaminase-like cysteine peptidase [Sphingomonas sp. LY29]|uniref:transglutaminase-like cysteine peptidase n=1 Tax=Sphingomonas sp. LY29 TaxID=3095341 RepID=UPI002D77D587|nr:transglutaminase-like cysteine peptidase [Sphingomonas sp. LY29]WRP24859.1 transglutaminase-like cysteine peptidase [Sphingomonas sp. LY29]